MTAASALATAVFGASGAAAQEAARAFDVAPVAAVDAVAVVVADHVAIVVTEVAEGYG